MGLIVVNFCAILITGILAGVHIAGPAGLNAALRSLDASYYLVTKQAIDRTMPKTARPLMLATMGTLTVVTVLALLAGRQPAVSLDIVALALSIVTLAAILWGDLPINREIANWKPDSPPKDWQRVQRRWERYFLIRTLSMTAAFTCVTAAALIPGR